MKKYIKIMRLDHWIKQLFIVPGIIFAFILVPDKPSVSSIVINVIFGFLATCMIASANYVINEWLDAEFDKYHPTKKNRQVVSQDVNGKIVWALWIVLTAIGFVLGYFVGKVFLLLEIWLWVMGILYNVKPIRTKDVFILDVLSESVNNAIRLMMGWSIISADTIPPSSIILGYWMAGAFLMAIKRFAEYRMIGNPELAGKYRKSFEKYSEKSLFVSAFFYAMCSVFFLGVFLIKYRIEFLLLIPALIGLFCYYLWLSFKENSVVQKPEALFREKGLMIYCAVFVLLFVLLVYFDIPFLKIFTDNELIKLG